jgi:hypothetical protein
VLLVGAGDPAARVAALFLTARGAALLAAAPRLDDALAAAGLAAATGATARVIEEASPPLGGRALLERAREVLSAPTDALLAVSAFPDAGAADRAAAALARELPNGLVVRVEARPEGGAKAHAARLLDRFLAAAR